MGSKNNFQIFKLNLAITTIPTYEWVWFDVGIDYTSPKINANWFLRDNTNIQTTNISFSTIITSGNYDLLVGGGSGNNIQNICSCYLKEFKYYPNSVDYYPANSMRSNLGKTSKLYIVNFCFFQHLWSKFFLTKPIQMAAISILYLTERVILKLSKEIGHL